MHTATVTATDTDTDDRAADDLGRNILRRARTAVGAMTFDDAVRLPPGDRHTDAPDEDSDAPITADELAAWDRVGRVLVAHPAALRRVLAALSTVQPVRPRAGGGTP